MSATVQPQSQVPRRLPGSEAASGPDAASLRPSHEIAVVIPCRNEAETIGSVVKAFAEALPSATVYVFDNGSRDASAARAAEAGALVRTVSIPGKGNVVRRMFSDVDADYYILVDGDGTYDPQIAPQIVAKLAEGHDLVNVARVAADETAFRPGHAWGNRVLGSMMKCLFGLGLSDMLSGYKGCSRRLVKSFPVGSSGFEIETELAVHALQLRVAIDELHAPYRGRPAGSQSKLDTWGDGAKILAEMLGLVRHGRPLAFFGVSAAAVAVAGTFLGLPILFEYKRSHMVPRLPTAVLAMGLELLAAQSLATGLMLDTVSRARREQRMIAFLATSASAR